MKRFVKAALAVLLSMLLLAGCQSAPLSANEKNETNEDKISVVATIFPPYDFVREIAGDNVTLTMLLPPGSESHSYEPTPQDIIAIQNCDVFLYVGGESDAWIDEVLSSMEDGGRRLIKLMDCVQPVEEELVEGMEEEEEEEDEGIRGPEYDEHVWTSPKNAKLIAAKISETLCETDPANAETYQTNTEAYLKKLDTLDAAFQDVVDSAARKTIVFGDRFPFRYFADAYGLDYFAAFPGCSAETEASAGTVAFLIDKIKAERIPAVFHIELSNEKMADTIAEATNAKKLLLHACHNISKADFESGVGYLDLMTNNVAALKEALS
ncbi:MAG TPA: metal ABC transporter substrate-binding protein [Feifaniaceae bacterium]|nr:metal ABC transporter substrate-binding protein [Feifaniaceae bacterium]